MLQTIPEIFGLPPDVKADAVFPFFMAGGIERGRRLKGDGNRSLHRALRRGAAKARMAPEG